MKQLINVNNVQH